jgi:hypothetical protein
MAIMNKKTLLVVAALFSTSNAYTNSHDLRRKFGVTTPSSPQQKTVAHAAMDTTDPFGAPKRRRTMPSSNTAHGILSPETVSRMDENTLANGRSNPAVEEFLSRYRRTGPMSCLEMLSDPEVLPHLTQAMRDIA